MKLRTPSRNPGDLEILEDIYTAYLPKFEAIVAETNESRSLDKAYLPIDMETLSRRLRVNQEILWGRLFYHLDSKHGYERGNGRIHLFSPRGSEMVCNFPLLSAVVSERQRESRRYMLTLCFSAIALIVAIASLVIKAHS